MYYISSHDFGPIQTTRVDIYIFTTETLYKISSRAHLPPSLRTGKITVECACPEAIRIVCLVILAGYHVPSVGKRLQKWFVSDFSPHYDYPSDLPPGLLVEIRYITLLDVNVMYPALRKSLNGIEAEIRSKSKTRLRSGGNKA
jgi:hypothetical protein